jgi:hypothetical protein
MNPKSKRLFARPKTEYGNYTPRRITFRTINQMHYEYLLGILLSSRRYLDYNILKQIIEYQKQKTKAENTANKLAHFRLEPWMSTQNSDSFGGRLLDKIRNKTAQTALALFTAFLFCLPVYPEDVRGKVVESGSSYGVPSVKVEIYVNGKATPTTTLTGSQGNFSSAVVGVEESPKAELLNFEIAVGPNPGSTQTLRFNNPTPGKLEITVYDILGKKVKTLHNAYTNTGTYTTDWNGENEHGQRVSDGIYIYTILTEKEKKIIKTVIMKNAPHSIGTEYTLKNEGKSGLFKIETTDWTLDSLKLIGQNIETKTLTGFGTQTGDLELGNIFVEGTNVITGYAYDLWTKFNNRTGIQNLEVRIKSIPEKIILTDTNGIFIYKTTRTGQDSLIIISPEYYNWKHPININTLTEVKAFNDNTGIPMIKRYEETGIIPVYNGTQWIDSLATDDLMEFTQKITDVRSTWLEDPVYKNTVPRLKNGLVYLNRQNAPVGYYPDSTFAGMKAQENEQLIFTETTDSTAGTIRMKYTNANVGNGDEIVCGFDEQGPYIKYWVINIRGPPGSTQVLQAKYVAPVVAHEIEHAIFSSGELSPFITDILYGSPLSYHDRGYPNTGSQKEIQARKIITFLERNPKLLEYSK